jgi:hypothetical protein
MNFREAIIAIITPLIKKTARRGVVENIDLDTCTCDVDLGNNTKLHGVKLKANEGGKEVGIVVVPKDKTNVVAAMVEGVESDWVLTQTSEVESVAVFFKDGKMELKNNGEIHLNGENFGELIKIAEAVKKWNAIEDKVNEILTTLKGVNVALAPSGTFPFAPIFSPITPLTKTVVNDVKNDKVKHGG